MERPRLVNVVGVLPIYPPCQPVGSFLATHELLKRLVARGHSVTVYRRMRGGVPHDHDGVLALAGHDDAVVTAAIAAAHLVISHCGDDEFAATTAAEHDVPNVRLAHSPQPTARFEGAALAVFNSHSLAAEVAWDGPQIVVHPPRRTGTDAQPGTKVTLVNLTYEKGGELFWRLARSAPHIDFLAVEGGWGKQIVERRPNVVKTLPTQDIAAIYAQTRILLMPSSRESWGMVGHEAMACGIPVIAHPTPGLRESLGAAGIFVDRTDGQGWLHEIERLQDAAQWEAASVAARGRAVELSLEDGPDRFVEAVESVALISGGLAA